MNPADPEDRTVFSAEFVIGTLEDDERERFIAQMAADRALQAEVGYWQDRLLGLTRRIAPVEPSDAVWQRIDAAVQGGGAAALVSGAAAPVGGRAAAGGSPATGVPQEPPHRQEPPPLYAGRPAWPPVSPAPPFWQRLGFWRAFSGLAVAASVVLALLLLMPLPAPPDFTYVAVLQSPDKTGAGWLVSIDENRGPVKLVPLSDPGTIPPGKAWEFWTKGKDAAGPTSLGLLRPGGTLEVPRDRLPYLGDQQLFEITLEPETGSPIGRPTGPILFVGTATRV